MPAKKDAQPAARSPRGFRAFLFPAALLCARALFFPAALPAQAPAAPETSAPSGAPAANGAPAAPPAGERPAAPEEPPPAAPDAAARPPDAARVWVLSLGQEDCLAVPAPKGGYDIYIRKKPAIASVLLSAYDTSASHTVAYALRAEHWNETTGDEITLFEHDGREQLWYLVDSTPEYDPLFGEELFHIYLPPEVFVFYGETPTVLHIAEGLAINIRAYNMPYANPAATWQDNQYIIASHLSDDAPSLKSIYKANMRVIPVYEPLLPHPSFLRLGTGVSLFNPGREGAVQNKNYDLRGQINPLADFIFSHNPVPNFGFMLGFERDPLLMNRIVSRVKGDWSVFGFEAGGFLGLMNPQADILSPGLSVTLMAYLWDGFITAQTRFDSALGRALNGEGDFLQDLYEAQITLEYGRLTFDVRGSYRVFVRGTRALRKVTNDWFKIGGGVTLEAAKHPFSAGLSAGYQTLSLRYPQEDDPLDYFYDNVFTGYNMRFRLPHNIELFFDLEFPLSPLNYIVLPADAPVLLRAYIGMLWILGR